MKILAFDVDSELLGRSQASLSDAIRMALYQADSELFEKLNYDDDVIFLEPTLFCYFLLDVNTADKTPLEQCLLGYTSEANRPASIALKADRFGLVNLPNLGYLHANSNEVLRFSTQKIVLNTFLENSKIRLCLHPTDHLSYEEGITFDEPIEQTLQKNREAIREATHFFQTYLSEFWQAIESVTREFVVFSSPPQRHSFAGIMQHGTAYFNVENKAQTPVFFIDDIAHQCGHVIFNALTLETEKYLCVPKDQSLAGFIESPNEIRGVYGAFHGLFTYTTILNSLDKVSDLKTEFENDLRHEVFGRMGFIFKNLALTFTA